MCSVQIDVLSTTFVRVNNKVMIVPNHKLYGQCIENLYVCRAWACVPHRMVINLP